MGNGTKHSSAHGTRSLALEGKPVVKAGLSTDKYFFIVHQPARRKDAELNPPAAGQTASWNQPLDPEELRPVPDVTNEGSVLASAGIEHPTLPHPGLESALPCGHRAETARLC
jgi:hypothetical protein